MIYRNYNCHIDSPRNKYYLGNFFSYFFRDGFYQYNHIVKKYALDIVQMIHLNTGHQMCIPKTFWLKIIQRKYKNYYKKLQERIRRAKHPKALLRRQITGKRF